MSNEQRTRELAHQIWESEGCPNGEHTRHWDMACKLLEGEQQGELQPATARKPPARKARSKTTASPVKAQAQVEKPALLDKPAGAGKPAKTRRQAIARTTKITEPGTSDTDSPRE